MDAQSCSGYCPYVKSLTPNWALFKFGFTDVLVVKLNESAYGRFILDIAIAYHTARKERVKLLFVPLERGPSIHRVNDQLLRLQCRDVDLVDTDSALGKLALAMWKLEKRFGRKIKRGVRKILTGTPSRKQCQVSSTYRRRTVVEKLPVFLKEEDAKKAEAALAEIGVPHDARIVTVHMRTSQHDQADYTDTAKISTRARRSVEQTSYSRALAFLADLGYTVVRIGTDGPVSEKLSGVFDVRVAGGLAPLLEVYALLKSQFFISTDSGPTLLPLLTGTPNLSTNNAHWAFQYPLRSTDIYLLKRVLDKTKGKELSLDQLFEYEYVNGWLDLNRYQYIDNTDEEILAAVKEMEAHTRLSDPESDKQQKYRFCATKIASAIQSDPSISPKAAVVFGQWGPDFGFLGNGRLAQIRAVQFEG